MAQPNNTSHSDDYQMVDMEDGLSRSPSDATSDSDEEEDFDIRPPRMLGNELPHNSQRRERSGMKFLPEPVARPIGRACHWIQGPDSPRPYRITPLFESVQTAPVMFLHRLVKRRFHRACFCVLIFCMYILAFTAIISQAVLPKQIGAYGQPAKLACTSKLWPSSIDCGLDGQDCLPFNNHSVPFSCPADCKRVQVLNVYTVGVEEVNYQPLVIGGISANGSGDRSVYRGDSFICAAAIHAGVIDNERGGCGIVSRVGETSDYQAVERNGISSIGFNSTFPLSFSFENESEESSQSLQKCGKDPRWTLLALSVVFASMLSMLTSTPSSFFASIFVVVYFQVALASDPPPFRDYDSGFSIATARFLPAAFVGFFIYTYCVRHTLNNLNAHVEKTILWLGACWVGALSNNTLDQIPIQRLTPHDLAQQPGAITALIIIVFIIVAIAIGQAWAFWVEGRLPRYLAIYCILAAGLLTLVVIPRLNLRIHHYILALLLLPGTALQTRPSLLYQGFLVGLFINGIARWDFDGVLQTTADLRGDAKLESLLPQIFPPLISSSNITFSWDSPSNGWEGVSVLVNDVERFRGFQGENDDRNETSFTWTRDTAEFPEYFRFGYAKYLSLGGLWFGDYTKAGVWNTDGSWQHMLPGPS